MSAELKSLRSPVMHSKSETPPSPVLVHHLKQAACNRLLDRPVPVSLSRFALITKEQANEAVIRVSAGSASGTLKWIIEHFPVNSPGRARYSAFIADGYACSEFVETSIGAVFKATKDGQSRLVYTRSTGIYYEMKLA